MSPPGPLKESAWLIPGFGLLASKLQKNKSLFTKQLVYTHTGRHIPVISVLRKPRQEGFEALSQKSLSGTLLRYLYDVCRYDFNSSR